MCIRTSIVRRAIDEWRRETRQEFRFYAMASKLSTSFAIDAVTLQHENEIICD